MLVENLVPSTLTSWVAWRNQYTERDGLSFNKLKEEFGISTMPTRFTFLKKHNDKCPFCKGDTVLYDDKFGLVYCICELLLINQSVEAVHNTVRTKVNKAYISDIKYPRQMGDAYIETMRNAVDEVRRFIRYPNKWLYIAGYYGTGKTHLMKAINTAFYPIALYVSARDLEQLTHEFRKEDNLDYFYSALTDAPILLLDDIGMEYGGPLVKSIIEKVIDARYEFWDELPTVISTNKPSNLMETYIPRAFDRMMDKEKVTVLNLKAEMSYRDIPLGSRV